METLVVYKRIPVYCITGSANSVFANCRWVDNFFKISNKYVL